jgi:hypothetical protein
MEGGWGETVVGESPITYIQRRVREIVAKMRDLERAAVANASAEALHGFPMLFQQPRSVFRRS